MAGALYVLFFQTKAAGERYAFVKQSLATDAEREAFRALHVGLISFDPIPPEHLQALRRLEGLSADAEASPGQGEEGAVAPASTTAGACASNASPGHLSGAALSEPGGGAAAASAAATVCAGHDEPRPPRVSGRPGSLGVGVGEEGAREEASTKSVDAPGGGDELAALQRRYDDLEDRYGERSDAFWRALGWLDEARRHLYDMDRERRGTSEYHDALDALTRVLTRPADSVPSAESAPVASTPGKTPAGEALALLDKLCEDSLENPLAKTRHFVGTGEDDGDISTAFARLADLIEALAGVSPGTEAPGEAPTKTVGAPAEGRP